MILHSDFFIMPYQENIFYNGHLISIRYYDGQKPALDCLIIKPQELNRDHAEPVYLFQFNEQEWIGKKNDIVSVVFNQLRGRNLND